MSRHEGPNRIDTVALDCGIPKVADFTAYCKCSKEFDSQLSKSAHQSKSSDPLYEVDCEHAISGKGRLAPGGPRRIHACRCFKGAFWSLTVRQRARDGLVSLEKWAPKIPRKTAFTPEPYEQGRFLNSHGENCAALYRLIFPEHGIDPAGMVVVTGSTGSGKSNIVRGLIDLYLRDKGNLGRWYERQRVPHLVTYEDPIEVMIFEKPETDLGSWLDYTPRQKWTDVADLRAAKDSALRQTPAVFYVGEVRDIKEWKVLLDFAGTGHLIFTTAHAGSLVEAMGKIFVATGAKNAARRAIVADRLVALVHLRQGQLAVPLDRPNRRSVKLPQRSPGHFVKNITVPALWRQTVSGAKALMSEGQSSLLPHAPDAFEFQSCFGRTWFAEQLWTKGVDERTRAELESRVKEFNRSKNSAMEGKTWARVKTSKLHSLLQQTCEEWDLEGL